MSLQTEQLYEPKPAKINSSSASPDFNHHGTAPMVVPDQDTKTEAFHRPTADEGDHEVQVALRQCSW